MTNLKAMQCVIKKETNREEITKFNIKKTCLYLYLYEYEYMKISLQWFPFFLFKSGHVTNNETCKGETVEENVLVCTKLFS